MKHYKATRVSDGHIEFLMSEDTEDAPPGYVAEEWTFELLDTPPTEFQSATAHLDLAEVKAWGRRRIERLQEEANSKVQRLIAGQAISETWQDIKRLERDQAAGTIPSTAELRWEAYPYIMAIVSESGATLSQAATTAKAELAEPMRKIALFAARALLAKRNIANATTPEGVEVVVNSVSFVE